MTVTKQVLKSSDVLNIFYAREFALDILRRFFIEEPSQEYMKQLVQMNMIDLFPFQEESKGIKAGVKEIKDYLSNHNPGSIEKHFENLHWDYTRMFIGPFEIQAAPWESFYVTKERLLFQRTTMDVRKLYKKYGFQTAQTNIEADDHIGLELDFLFHLNQLCITSGESRTETSIREIMYLLEEQQSFLDDHLEEFVPRFSDLVIEHADTGMFKGMAKLLRHYLEIDAQVLKELLSIELVQD